MPNNLDSEILKRLQELYANKQFGGGVSLLDFQRPTQFDGGDGYTYLADVRGGGNAESGDPNSNAVDSYYRYRTDQLGNDKAYGERFNLDGTYRDFIPSEHDQRGYGLRKLGKIAIPFALAGGAAALLGGAAAGGAGAAAGGGAAGAGGISGAAFGDAGLMYAGADAAAAGSLGGGAMGAGAAGAAGGMMGPTTAAEWGAQAAGLEQSLSPYLSSNLMGPMTEAQYLQGANGLESQLAPYLSKVAPAATNAAQSAASSKSLADTGKGLLGPAATLAGAAAGAQGQPGSETTRKLDPRLDALVFGDGGLTSRVAGLLSTPMPEERRKKMQAAAQGLLSIDPSGNAFNSYYGGR